MDIYFNVTNKFHSLDVYFGIIINDLQHTLHLHTDECTFVLICINDEIVEHIKSLMLSEIRKLETNFGNKFIYSVGTFEKEVTFFYNGAKFKIVTPITI